MPDWIISKAIPPTSLNKVGSPPTFNSRASYIKIDLDPVAAVSVPISKQKGLWYFSLGINNYKAIPAKEDLTPQTMPVLLFTSLHSNQLSGYADFVWPAAHSVVNQTYLLLLLHPQIFLEDKAFPPQPLQLKPNEVNMYLDTIQRRVIEFFDHLNNNLISDESIRNGLYPPN